MVERKYSLDLAGTCSAGEAEIKRGSGRIDLGCHTIRLQVEQQRSEATFGYMVVLEQLGEGSIAECLR